jgi:hypothetical protein
VVGLLDGLPPVDVREAYIRSAAAERGIDPDTAVRVARSEGLAPNTWQSNFARGGRREPSFGDFQLLVGGPGTGYPVGLGNEMLERTGLDPSDPNNWQKSVDFALDNARAGGWGPWYGAKRVGITGRAGIDGNPTAQPSLLAPPEAEAPMANNTGMNGLLSDALNSPMFQMGMGLLAAGGPSLMPTSTGQALAQGAQQATAMQQQQIENQLMRDKLSVERAAPSAIREMQTLGIPLTPEGFQQYNAMKTPTDTSLQDVLRQQQITEAQARQAERRGALENTAISATVAIQAMEGLEAIPGADVFLTNPGLIKQTRDALALGRVDPTGIISGLPSRVSGIPQDQLETALDLAETVNKQRNALGTSLASQGNAGATGLRARLEALGESAGPKVQRDVFRQALELTMKQATDMGEPIDLSGFQSSRLDLTAPPQAEAPNEPLETIKDSVRSLRQRAPKAADKLMRSIRERAGDTASAVGEFIDQASLAQPEAQALVEGLVQSGKLKVGDVVTIAGQQFRIEQ